MQSAGIEITGVISARPASTAFGACTLQELLPLNTRAVYASGKGASISVSATSPSPPFVLPLEGIVAVRLFAMRLLSGDSIRVTITTPVGTATFPVSDEFVLHNVNPGDEITAISFVGSAEIAYAIAGDVT